VKPPDLDLIEGRGALASCLILWRGTCPGWLSPPNGDPGSTQILTRHYSAQSQIISQLKSSRAMLTSKFPQPSPSGLSKRLRTGSMQMAHHILTTWTEPWGFIELSASNQTVHMELNLRLSFYLRRSLEGYIVGTTKGFLVEIMEALSPPSRH
jgi:hypothetical protein